MPYAKCKVGNVLHPWVVDRSFRLLRCIKVTRCIWRTNCIHTFRYSIHSREYSLTRMWKPLCFIMSFLSASSTSISFVTFTEQRHSFSTLVFSLFRGFQHANRTLLGTVEPYYLDLFLLPSQRNSSVQIENPSDIKVLCLLSTTLSSLWNVPVGCFGGKMIKEGIWKIQKATRAFEQ